MILMYRLFCENFSNYLKTNEYDSHIIDARFKLAEPFFGLTDINIYELWEKNNPHMYEEVNNLVFGIYAQKDQYRRFAHFAWELGILGYQPIKSKGISELTLTEQLNLVKLVLSFQYGEN